MNCKLQNNTWAIIPARAGSIGFKDKNIAELLSIPLLAHSINFAKKLKFVDRILLSTDDLNYKKIGESFGADVPFLRSTKVSSSTSMEEDVLLDIKNSCESMGILVPDTVVWLRPTHPLRSVEAFEKAYEYYTVHKCATCLVTKADPRIFIVNGTRSTPVVSAFRSRSMVRRQESPQAFRLFHGEIFDFPRSYNPNFLGNNWSYIYLPEICHFDIDDKYDLIALENIILANNEKYEAVIHKD